MKDNISYVQSLASDKMVGYDIIRTIVGLLLSNEEKPGNRARLQFLLSLLLSLLRGFWLTQSSSNQLTGRNHVFPYFWNVAETCNSMFPLCLRFAETWKIQWSQTRDLQKRTATEILETSSNRWSLQNEKPKQVDDIPFDIHTKASRRNQLTRPFSGGLCSELKVALNSFQHLHFDGSLWPLLITWCYNHGIKKLPNHWWTRLYHFRDIVGYHGNSITC